MKISAETAAWSSLLVLALLCLWYPSPIGGSVVVSEKDQNAELLVRVLEAITKATEFFNEDYASINVDGLFGIRLCQGSLMESANDCSTEKFSCPTEVTTALRALNQSLSTIADMALPYVKEQDPEYYDKFVQTIDSPYIVKYTPEPLGYTGSTAGKFSHYDETQGDKCISMLMGTVSQNGRLLPKCTVSDECWEMMTQGQRSSYAITHQLLYFIIGESTGCLSELEGRVSSTHGLSVRELEKKMCVSIYSEALGEEREGEVEALHQDLFLEQSVLCGILGFQDFFSPRWMSMVLGWQSGRGCFTMAHQLVQIETELARAQEEQRQLLRMLGQEARDIDQASWKSRKLMREHIMKGDCLAHKTGLAFGTLGAYLRYLIYQLYH